MSSTVLRYTDGVKNFIQGLDYLPVWEHPEGGVFIPNPAHGWSRRSIYGFYVPENGGPVMARLSDGRGIPVTLELMPLARVWARLLITKKEVSK